MKSIIKKTIAAVMLECLASGAWADLPVLDSTNSLLGFWPRISTEIRTSGAYKFDNYASEGEGGFTVSDGVATLLKKGLYFETIDGSNWDGSDIGITIMVNYSNYEPVANVSKTFIATFLKTVHESGIGVYGANTLAKGIWSGAVWTGGNSTTLANSGTMFLEYAYNQANKEDTGTYVYNVAADGTASTVFYANGLRSNQYVGKRVNIGCICPNVTVHDTGLVNTNLHVHSVAIFKKTLTAAERIAFARTRKMDVTETCTFDGTTGITDLGGATATWSAGTNLCINVSSTVPDTVTLTLPDGGLNAGSLLHIQVASGKTLVLSGTVTATNIIVTGAGVVKVTNASTFSGTVKGDGTLCYTGVQPTIGNGGLTLTDSAWTGTLWLKDVGGLGSAGKTNAILNNAASLGNSGSKVKFTNVRLHPADANVTCGWTLVLEDGAGEGEYAWYNNNGWYNRTMTIAALEGNGTMYDNKDCASKVKIDNVANFTGYITASTKRIGLGANPSNSNGTIVLGSGVEVTIDSTHCWSATGGWDVSSGATMNVNADATVKFADSQKMLGTLNIAKGKTLTAASGDAVSHDTGSSTVNVYGTLNFDTYRWTIGPNTTINLYEDAIVQGTGDSNAAMDFNVSGGSMIHALGNATISCKIRNVYADGTAKINVDAGKTLTFSGNLVGSYGLKKQGDGILKLTGSIEKLPTIEAGTVLLGGNKEWNLGTLRDLSGYTLEAGSSIAITQTMAEYGSGVTTVTGIDSSIDSITVNKADGTTVAITPSDGAATLVESVVVSGAACWYDFTFTNTITTASGSSAGTVTLGKDAGPAYGTLTDAADNTYSGLYAYCRPYKDINLGSKTQFTVALYGTMPTADNTILLDCGGCGSAGALLLASGSSANEAKLYYYNSSGLTPLATMAATSCRTTPHLYVFEKLSDHQVNIYLDGKLALAYVNNDITFTLTAGFQVASGYAGTPSGLNAIDKTATTDTTIIAMTRIYDRIISDAEMAVLKTDWPYFSPNGDSARTLASGETAADWTETGKWTVNNASADTPLANSVVTLTNSAEADVAVSVNLDGNTEYESVTFAGDAAISVALKSGYTGKIVPASTSFETDTTVAYNAMSLTEGAVEVAAGKTLTFDVTSLINDTANSLAPVQLSGVATLGAGAAIAVTPTTSTLWNITATPDDGGNYWVNFNPKRANTSIYWKSTNSGDWTGVNDANHIFTTEAGGETTTPFYFGDTVVIRDDVQLWLKDSAAGISFSIENNATVKFSRSSDGATYAMKGQTVAIAAGATAQPERYANNGWDAGNPTIYGVTFTGSGNVKVVNGETLTLSGGSVISSPLTGSGTVNLESTSSMTVAPGASWTGTVVLPAITSHVNLTLYGNSDSTIGITSLNTYLTSPYTEIDSTLRLDGAMTISAFSNREYSFTKITGNGNLTFPNSNSPTAIAITELANYTGTLINNHELVGVDVTRVTKSVDVDGGALLLATNGVGEVSVSSFEVAGVAVSHYVAAGGFYRGAARYDGTVYKTFAEAIDAVEEDGASLSDITVLDGSATVPDGYYIDNGVVAKCPAAIVYDVGDPDYYNTVQAAVNAANVKTYAGNPYEYVAVYANAAVTTAMTLKIKPMNGAVVTVSVPDITSEYALNDETDENGVVTYMIDPASTDYTWVTGSGDVWDTIAVAPWRYDVESTPTEATRVPGSVDSVAFASAADVTVGANVSVSSMTVSSAITLTKLTADVTVTATAGGIVLTDAGASITVSGVTLSPAPTTTVAYSEIAYNEETRTYSVNKLAEASTESVDGVGEVEVIAPEEGVTSITVPAGTGKVAIPGTIAQITGVTANDLLLKVEYNNGSAQTAYYGGILSVANDGSVSLNGSATVDGVKVEPEVNTSSDPMTLSDTTLGFTVKTIPGLFYTVMTSDSATSGFDAAGATVQATTSSTSLGTSTDSWDEDDTVKYYRIKVSTTGND